MAGLILVIVSSPVEPQGWLKIIPGSKEIRDVFLWAREKNTKSSVGERCNTKNFSEYPLDVFRGKHLDETLCGGIFRRRRCDGVPGI